jgi:hypothetical protein
VWIEPHDIEEVWYTDRSGKERVYRVADIGTNQWVWAAAVENGLTAYVSDDGFNPRTYPTREAAVSAAREFIETTEVEDAEDT